MPQHSIAASQITYMCALAHLVTESCVRNHRMQDAISEERKTESSRLHEMSRRCIAIGRGRGSNNSQVHSPGARIPYKTRAVCSSSRSSPRPAAPRLPHLTPRPIKSITLFDFVTYVLSTLFMTARNLSIRMDGNYT